MNKPSGAALGLGVSSHRVGHCHLWYWERTKGAGNTKLHITWIRVAHFFLNFLSMSGLAFVSSCRPDFALAAGSSGWASVGTHTRCAIILKISDSECTHQLRSSFGGPTTDGTRIVRGICDCLIATQPHPHSNTAPSSSLAASISANQKECSLAFDWPKTQKRDRSIIGVGHAESQKKRGLGTLRTGLSQSEQAKNTNTQKKV